MTVAKALPRDLRFRLEMVAIRHGVNVKGFSTAEVVVKVLENSKLSDTDLQVMKDVCKFYEYDFKEIESMAKVK